MGRLSLQQQFYLGTFSPMIECLYIDGSTPFPEEFTSGANYLKLVYDRFLKALHHGVLITVRLQPHLL